MAYAKYMLLIPAFILLIGIAHSLVIDIDIDERLSGEMRNISGRYVNGVFKFEIEFYNSGSVPFRAIARMDLFDNDKNVFTSWDNYEVLEPGEKATFEVYAFVDSPGTYTPRIRIYFANEIVEKYYESRQVFQISSPEENFIISDVYAEDGYIEFDITSERTLDNVVFTADRAPPGWIFHQEKSALLANNTQRIRIEYEPDIERDAEAKLLVFSSDGFYHSSQKFDIDYSEEFELDKAISEFFSFLGSIFAS